jgi:hypothetical protein
MHICLYVHISSRAIGDVKLCMRLCKVCVYVFTYICIYVYISSREVGYVEVCVCKNVYMYISTRMYICVYVYTVTGTYTHTYTHMHAHTHIQISIHTCTYSRAIHT